MPMSGIRACRYWILTPATEIDPVVRNPGGMPRGSLPNVNSTTLSMTMPRATVAISQEFDPRSTKGRTATRSTMTPHSAHAASATTTATMSGMPRLTHKLKHSTAPSIMVLPCAKFTVLETAWVTWKPNANSPYMLPNPSPEMIADVTNMTATCSCSAARLGGAARPAAPIRLLDGDDLVALVVHHDVVVRSSGVVTIRRERPRISLDQAFIGSFQVLERRPNGIGVGRASLFDPQGEQVHRV